MDREQRIARELRQLRARLQNATTPKQARALREEVARVEKLRLEAIVARLQEESSSCPANGD